MKEILLSITLALAMTTAGLIAFFALCLAIIRILFPYDYKMNMSFLKKKLLKNLK